MESSLSKEIIFLLNEIYKNKNSVLERNQNHGYQALLAMKIPWKQINQTIEEISLPQKRYYLRSWAEFYNQDYITLQLKKINLKTIIDKNLFEQIIFLSDLILYPNLSYSSWQQKIDSAEDSLRFLFAHHGWDFKTTICKFENSKNLQTSKKFINELILNTNSFLFNELKAKNSSYYFFKTSSHLLWNLLDQKQETTFFQITLLSAIIFLRLGFQVYFINFPKATILKIKNNHHEFYIESKTKLKILTKQEILLKAKELELSEDRLETYFAESNYRTVFQKKLANLQILFDKIKEQKSLKYVETLHRIIVS